MLAKRHDKGALALAAVALLAVSPAMAQSEKDFFKGKVVRLVNGGSPGSGYDTYSRMLAPHLEKALGAKVIVENRPGAGMMIAMNHIWTQKPDGLRLLLAPGEGAALGQLIDSPGIRFELQKFGILARVNTGPRLLIVNPKTPYKSILDVMKSGKTLQIGSNGKTDGSSDTTAFMCHALKLKCKITIGYKSSRHFALAAKRGEVDGTVLVEDSSKRYSAGGELRAIVVTSRERSKLFPEVPTVFEAVKLDKEAAWWLDFRDDVRKIGRLLVVPPGMDAKRLAFLRKVAKDIITDPQIKAEFAKRRRPLAYGDPQEMTKLVNNVLGGLSPERKKEIKQVILEKYY